MVSEVKANKISPATGTAFTFGDSGDTFTVPSGCTIVNSGTATGFTAGADTDLSNLSATGENRVAQVWAIFDGAGSGTIDDYNVSSITDNGTGDYTINFTSALANVTYCSVSHACDPNHNASLLIAHSAGTGADRTTSSERVLCQYTGGAASDGDDFISYMAFGD